MAKKGHEFRVAEMEIKARRIGAHPVATAAEEAVKRKAGLLCREVPECHLHGFFEGQGIGTLVATARPVHAVYKGERRMPLKGGPHFGMKDTHYFGEWWKRPEQGLGEAEAGEPMLVDQ